MSLRPIRIEGDVAFVPLTRGYEATIDAADVPLVEGRNWYAQPNKRTVYAYTHRRAADGEGSQQILMHRILLTPRPDQEVDHIDGDGLHNMRRNLRACTHQENARNARVRGDNTSGLKGVSWRRDLSKWQASIWAEGRRIHLGYFDSAADAAAAYAKASAELHGEFGRIA